MSEEIKKEMQDVEINQDELEPVAGGCSEESRFKNDEEEAEIIKFLKLDVDYKPAENPINLDRPKYEPERPLY